jgi:hypothetical protein
MGVETARGVLDITEDGLFQLLERGAFWAWDIAVPHAKRRMLRFLCRSITAITHERAMQLLEDQLALITPEPGTKHEAIALVMERMSNGKPYVTAKEIKRALNFGRTHMNDLIAGRAMPEFPGTSRRPGPNGHAIISREAFTQFLEDRIVC